MKPKKLIWITILILVVILIIAAMVKPRSSGESFEYDQLPVLGSKDAPVKIVEFGDFKCPSCQVFALRVEPLLKQDYIDTGIASLYFMNFTIIGPDSYTAALAGQSIFHQNNDAFWQFYEAIYKNQGDERVAWATPDFLSELARKQGLKVDLDKLHQDILGQTYRAEVEQQNAKADKAKVQGTPTLFINGKKFEDVFDYAKLKAAIEQARKQQ